MRSLPLGLLAFTCLLILATAGQAQVFLGKTANAWIQELNQGDDAARRNAAYALGKLGGTALQAVPRLTKRLAEDKSPKVREAAAFALGEIGRESPDPAVVAKLTAALKDENHLVRRSAAYALGNLGRDAAAAQADLEGAVADPKAEVRQNAAWALGKIGSGGVAGLRKALGDADLLVRRDAAAALAPMAAKDIRPALPELLAACATNNSEVRKAALAALVKVVGPSDAAAAGPIRQALTDADEEVRRNAALALSNIGGKEARAALPVLRDALRRGDVELRRQAAAAIRNIGLEAHPAVPDLIKALGDADGEVRANAALALGGIGQNAEDAVPALVQLIANAKEIQDTRVEAAVSLSKIGPGKAAVEAVPTLLKVLQDPAQNAKVRERIVWALRVHKAKLREMPDLYPIFTKILVEPKSKENRMLRYDCAFMLGVLKGPDAPPEVMGVLLEYLKDDSILIFANKKTTVGGTGPETPTGKTDVKEEGKDDGRILAIQALARIGAARIAERPDIVQQLQFLAKDKATLDDLRKATKELLEKLK